MISSFTHLDDAFTSDSRAFQFGFIARNMSLKARYKQLTNADYTHINTVFTSLNNLAAQIENVHDVAKQAFEREQQVPSQFDHILSDSRVGMGFYNAALRSQYCEYDFADLMYESCTSPSSSSLHVLSPIAGFSKHNVQLYSKRMVSWTTFHSEIGYSAAYNVNHTHSKGVSFWIGFSYIAASRVMSRNELDAIMHGSNLTMIDVVQFIRTMTQPQHDGRKEKVYIAVQYPNMVKHTHTC